jgi:hypothetical protein
MGNEQQTKMRVFIEPGSHRSLTDLASDDRRNLGAELDWLIEQEVARRQRERRSKEAATPAA